jgi:hypothetical protein
LLVVHRSEGRLYSKKDLQQTTNKKTLTTSHNEEAFLRVVFYDLNATLADTYVVDSIGPTVLNSSYNQLLRYDTFSIADTFLITTVEQ